ncbi:cob(I)yrinic acid a,c-diamide adenosyltransferase [Kushneria phosphatilytica]|uniref:Corrinoid adenosyltransferase n=1 Tax=Kushneria phosphatilytica TaxID=657387 RepID=A0A1S1NRJ0_9GAMM|nr:cob(I)yrinic acid a,c-diamide adenosyltransferase [Kushneria phosphatilytica]OHV11874.1 cob(I)yrinic acid a,c-diamide adenosyltransferase [Kushneria phosphatilytica]QEL11047.1 cob(I)yrinic acid a,c-diamide adenosyltransferase [Kushneria phosphatilytica]
MSQQQSDAERHERRMTRKKQVVDERIAAASEERGVLILMKGNGKGKSSSGFGTMTRALGHGMRCAVIQFIKGRRETGEYRFFREHERVDFHVMGHGFSWETRDLEQDRAAAKQAWQLAEQLLKDESYNFLLFDELSYMIKYGHLEAERVAHAIAERPHHQNVIVTGRTMARELQVIADTISVINDERHAFRLGVKAQAGIEY